MHRYERKFPEATANGGFAYREWLYSNICKWASGILVDSEIGKQQAIDSYDCSSHKIHVLPYVAPRYVYSSQEQVNFCERHDLPARYVFYPGQLWKHKNHINLIRAIDLLRKKGLSVNAVFSGAPKNGADDIYREIERLNLTQNVFCAGYVTVNELVDLYRNAVALVMPTFFGPTNIPVLEAFALGCPAAVSQIYGMPEQVGDAALTFDPNDVGEIANAIELLWTDPSIRESLIRRGYSRAKEWDQEKFNSRLLEIVRGMLD